MTHPLFCQIQEKMSWYEPNRSVQFLSNYDLLKNLVDSNSSTVENSKPTNQLIKTTASEPSEHKGKRKAAVSVKPGKKKVTPQNFI